MRATFFYNWPPEKEIVLFSLGAGNIEDPKYEFQVLFKIVNDSTMSRFGINEWMNYEETKNLTHSFKRGAVIQVKRRLINNPDTVETCFTVDTNKEWPLEAIRESSTNVFFDF